MQDLIKQSILKFLCAACLCVLTFSAQALEIKGVKVDETAQVGGSTLVLNGAGLRTKMMFKVYVAALYLGQKQSEVNAIIHDQNNKRITMHFLREVSSDKLIQGMDEALVDNNTPAELAAIEPQLKSFRQLMASAKEVKNGDVIILDFMPSTTQFIFNGKVMGKIEGEAFDEALLRVWLGEHAVDASLRKALLSL